MIIKRPSVPTTLEVFTVFVWMVIMLSVEGSVNVSVHPVLYCIVLFSCTSLITSVM